MRLLMIAILIACCGLASAQTAPDHLGSLEFRSGDPSISLERFRGKMTIVLFFQSWCGICNNWSPQLIEQMDKAYGGDHRFALVAVKTDRGGVQAAEKYLLERNADLNNWYIAGDHDAEWYKAYDPKAPLFGFALVGPDGKLLEYGKAGMQSGGKFSLASAKNKLVKQYGATLSPVLPAKERGAEAASVVKAIEARDFTAAYMSLQGVKGDSGKALRSELDGLIQSKGETLSSDMQSKTGNERFLAYIQLRDLSAELKGHPALKAFSKELRSIAREDDIKVQLKAEQAWIKVQGALAKAKNADQRLAIITQTKEFFEKRFPDTYYGRQAAAL